MNAAPAERAVRDMATRIAACATSPSAYRPSFRRRRGGGDALPRLHPIDFEGVLGGVLQAVTILGSFAVPALDVGFAREEQELGRQTREFQRLQREFREDLNLRRNEELSALFDRANKVIKQIAETEKYDLIIQEAVYRSTRIDITEKVIKALAADK